MDNNRQLSIDYAVIFNSEHGVRVLADLMQYCGYKESAYIEDSARRTDFLLGRQTVALYINAMLETAKINDEIQKEAVHE